ncbi:MAG TPA: endo-1,4-beta-xylanase [Candidatus Faeciplasma avium]|uniref:Beta-xylanase n=1 Tax=Candidatus Faeciplasma avium TaxID=2840798 RepID=A0A9D1NR93_9FIRM|nr:endo-1,4-beta-xylanase [Candidatus Faeciplasma avium]
MKTLKEAYKDYFTVGAAVAAHWLDEASECVKQNFSTLTAENEMKYMGVHNHSYKRPDFRGLKPGERPEPPEITSRERFVHPSLETDAAPGLKIYNFARSNGILMRGHTLSWHGSYPWGIFEQLTPEELEANTIEHYEFVSRTFPGCYCWDVVNEAASDKREDFYLRRTPYRDKFGDDYLIKLYRLARKYFPDAKLCCNDYNEFVPHKRDRILRIVNELKAEGLVDVIGCQCHVNVHLLDKKDGFDEIKRSYDLYAETGLKLHITEMDVNCVDWERRDEEITPEAVKNVAEVYSRLFEIFRQYKGVIENVTLWGVSNKHSWLNSFKLRGRTVKNQPLLFDDDYQPTEAFYRVTEF